MEIKFTALDLSHSICKFAIYLRMNIETSFATATAPTTFPLTLLTMTGTFQHIWQWMPRHVVSCASLQKIKREKGRDEENGWMWPVRQKVNFYKQIYTFHFVHVFNIYFLRKYVSCQSPWRPIHIFHSILVLSRYADALWHQTKSKFIKNSIIKNT